MASTVRVRLVRVFQIPPVLLLMTCVSDQPLAPARSLDAHTLDTNAPTVAITAPLAGAVLTTPTVVTADAADDILMAGVEFFLNGVSLGPEDDAAPYEAALNTDTLPAAAADLTALARDAAGNTTVSAAVGVVVFHPDTTPPTVVITAPAAGSSITAPTNVTADASDDFLLAGVTFQANGVDLAAEDVVAPYEALLNTDTLSDGSYGLVAAARDTAGHVTTSDLVTISVFHPDVTPPSISITAPLDGATLTTPITVTADASDDGPVAGVQFKLNGVDLEPEDGTAPYEAQLNTDTLPDGPYDLTAVARDTAGNTTVSALVSITIFHPDVTPPMVAITAPLDGATITTPTTVTADASDDFLLAGVTFQANGVDLAVEDLVAPYEALLNTDTLPDGSYALVAAARDTAGHVTTSALVTVTVFHPDVTPPTVAITAPLDGATLTAPTTVTADASDNDLVAGVTFRANGVDLEAEDGTAPYAAQLNTDTLPNGLMELTAVARDAANNTTTSATVQVTIVHPDVTPPTVAITAPLDGATLTTPTTVTADASDDGQVAGVLFKLNGVDLEPEDITAPYEAQLNTDTLPNGPYNLTAVARDTANNTTTSATVQVTIFHPDVTPPTVAITAPLDGDTLTAPTTVTADASDDGLVAGVRFQANGVDLAAEDLVAPYETVLNTDTLPDGSYDLIAIARDTAGNVATSDLVTVTVLHADVTPPTVAITSPLDGDTLTTPTTVTADASDDRMLGGVEFRANGVSLGAEDETAPFEALLNTDTLPDGAYELSALARDTAGNTALSAGVTVTVFHPDVAPPTVAITAPLDGATISAPTTVTADATDDGEVAGVVFKLNGIDLGPEDLTAPYEALLNTDTLPDGAVDLTAVARDTAANTTTSAVVRVTVFHPDVTPPAVAITSPAQGATLAGVVTITADASDDRMLGGVQFKAGGVNIGAEDLTAPYSADLDTYTLPNGSIALTAEARDTAGNQTLSAAVDVTVFNPPPKNIVVIMVDDMRFDHLQYLPLMMGLLGPQSVEFTNSFASTPLCCPARATILGGRYSHNHGVMTNQLPTGGATKFNATSTIATWLHDVGYRNGIIGKYMNQYDLLSPAIPPGWDDFQVYSKLDGPISYYNYTLNENGTVRSYGTGVQNYSTTVFADRVVNFINTTPAGQPLMVFFTPHAPHQPATPHPSDIGRYASFPKWRPVSWNEAVVTDKTTLVKSTPRFPTSQINFSDKLHRSMLESLQSVDRSVVSIVSALQQQNRWDNTLLIFISDNGLSWGENRMLDRKSCPYEACIRIPLLVRVPGVSPRQESALVSNVDITPMIAAWAGITPPTPMSGLNLLDLIANPATPWRTELLVEQLGMPKSHMNFYSVRDSRYIYTEYLNGEKEFYDLQVDPYQMTSFINNSSYASIIAALKAKLAILRAS